MLYVKSQVAEVASDPINMAVLASGSGWFACESIKIYCEYNCRKATSFTDQR